MSKALLLLGPMQERGSKVVRNNNDDDAHHIKPSTTAEN